MVVISAAAPKEEGPGFQSLTDHDLFYVEFACLSQRCISLMLLPLPLSKAPGCRQHCGFPVLPNSLDGPNTENELPHWDQ